MGEKLHAYYLSKAEPNKSCLLALRSIILDQDKDITETQKVMFLDEDILKLVEGKSFEKVSDRWPQHFEKKIDDFVSILQDKFNASVSLNAQQFDLIKGEIPKRPVREKTVLKIQPRLVIQQTKSDDLELEAMALEIELELLEFAA